MQTKRNEDNGTNLVSNRVARLLSNMAKKNTAKVTAKAVTVKSTQAETQAAAVKFSLDLKGSHSLRVAYAAKGADLFALFGAKSGKVSRGYADSMAAATLGKETGAAWLLVGGVVNLVKLHENGYYSRAHNDNGKDVTLRGNVNELRALYGAEVSLVTREELVKLYSEAKEKKSFAFGKGKSAETVAGVVLAEVNGRVAFAYDVGNGKIAARNGEFLRNVHNYAVRTSLARG